MRGVNRKEFEGGEKRNRIQVGAGQDIVLLKVRETY